MPDTVAIRAPVYTRVEHQSVALPWYVYSLLVASASAMVGGLWEFPGTVRLVGIRSGRPRTYLLSSAQFWVQPLAPS